MRTLVVIVALVSIAGAMKGRLWRKQAPSFSIASATLNLVRMQQPWHSLRK